MSEPIVKLDEPKKNFDWQDVTDLMDEAGRQLDKKDETIKIQRNQLDQDIELMDIQRKDICKLREHIKEIELPLKMFDTVWYISDRAELIEARIYKIEINTAYVRYYADSTPNSPFSHTTSFCGEDISRSYFKNKEDAERQFEEFKNATT